jgi:signal transduction histidine kinase
LQQILTNALDKTLEIIGVEAGGIYILREEDEVLTMAVHKGFDAQFVVEVDNLKVGEGFSGRVALSGEPLIVSDLSIDSRLTRSVVRESGFHSLAVVPLVSRAKVLGTLTVATRGRREFSDQDIELLTSIGDQIGVAVENAQLYEQAQQAAVVEERQRLARELHDSISQSLHSSILLAEAGQRLAGAGDLERSRGYLVRLGEIAQQAMKEMRLLVYELRPLALREAGLEKALQQRLDTVERRAGVEAKLDVEGEFELADDIEEALFRIAQEALNNAMKHGAPTEVVVTLRLEADPSNGRVVLEVADNGLGFDRDSREDEGGIGLDSMRERVEKLGGFLTIVSKPGEGTIVKASVPMKAPTDSTDFQELGGT